MSTKSEEISKILEEFPQYRDTLFPRGYLITNHKFSDLNKYPFYGLWKDQNFGTFKEHSELKILYHEKQDCTVVEKNGIYIAIIGHAYNPFNMVIREEEILIECLDAYQSGLEIFFDKVNELTGIHLIAVNDFGKLIFVQDCVGMKSCYFGKVENDIYISSHPQLIGDICNLETDPFVAELVQSRTYNIGNRHLPGNITPFKELKRLGGNTYAEFAGHQFSIKRFYPVKPHDVIDSKEAFDKGIKEIAELLQRNIKLATAKWQRPAISLSGGNDSKTTLACANGLYEKFKLFSFFSKRQELVDTNAAHEICHELGLPHTIYEIPKENKDIPDFDILKKIIDHNTNYFKNTADNEIRKMIFLYHLNDFDIELKSWASETVRVFLERKYRVKMPEVLTERHFSIFQTRYFLVPHLLKKSDEIYREFLKEIKLAKPIYNYEHTDLFYWEVRMGAWGTSVVSSLDFCHNVTIPFNNRKLIEIFLTFPHEDRKADNVHKAIIRLTCPKMADLHVDIKNLYFHSYRIWLEKIYYLYRTSKLSKWISI